MTDIATSELLFDYESIPDGSRDVARAVAVDIKPRLRRTAEDIFAIGQGLIRAKDALPHGYFGRWAYDEFGLTARTAQRFMNVAERLGEESDNLSHLLPSVLYQLAAESTPPAAVERVIELSRAGEQVTTETARREIRRLRQPSPPQANGTGRIVLPVEKSGNTGDGMASRPTATCRRCHRPLSDPETAAAGIGHVCAAHEQRGGGGEADEPQTVELVDEMPVYGLSDDDVLPEARLAAEQRRGAANLLRTIGYGISYFQPHPAAGELGIEQEWEAAWDAIQTLKARLEEIVG